jgi:hypothetical protein
LDAQKIILKELSSEFGGSAAAQATAGEKLTATWKNFQEEVGTAFLPVIDQVMTVLSDKLLPALSSLFELFLKHKKTVVIIVALVAGLAIALKAAAVATEAYRTIMVVTTAVQWAFAAAVNAGILPILAIVAGIALLVVGFILLYKHSKKFREFIQATWKVIKESAAAVVHWFTTKFLPFFTKTLPGVLQGLIRWVRTHWKTILAVLTGPVGLAVLAIVKNWGRIRNAFKNAREWVTGTWRKGWNAVSGFVSGAVGRGRDRVLTIWTSIRGGFTRAKNWVRDVWSAGWSKLTDWLTRPITKAAAAIGRILGKKGLRATMANALTAIGKLWTKITDPIQNAIRSMIKFINLGLIKGGINWLLKKLGVKGGGLVPWIPVPNFKKMAHGGRVKGSNSYQRGGTDRVPLLGDRDEMMIGRGAVGRLDRALPGGLDYLNKYGKWPVGPAAETAGAFQNTPRGANAPVDMNMIPGNLAAIIRRGPRVGDRSGFGAAYPLAYANSQLGNMGWYNRCLAFVNAAWNYTIGRFRVATARQSAMAGPRNMRGMPPAGAGVYWDTGPAGHIALAAGDGTVYSNDILKAGRIDRVPQQMINKWGPYMGWWHPNGAKPGNAAFNPGGSAAGGGMFSALSRWIGNLDPIQWLKKKVGGAAKTGIAGGMFGAGLLANIPGLILDRAKDWLAGKFGGGASGAVGSVKGWSKDQLRNAATIISIARSLGFGDRGAQIALITAMQESTLRNLNFGDRDSLGLFQQRGAWGSARDRTTPAVAARMFLLGGQGGQPGLKSFPWRTMGLAEAAQAVQVSAFPGAYGKWIGDAAAMIGKFKVLDRGGRLPPGVFGYNGTGRSERVLSHAEEDALNRPIIINVYGAADRMAAAREIRSMLSDLDRNNRGVTLRVIK